LLFGVVSGFSVGLVDAIFVLRFCQITVLYVKLVSSVGSGL
jgi:hypothetical protein